MKLNIDHCGRNVNNNWGFEITVRNLFIITQYDTCYREWNSCSCEYACDQLGVPGGRGSREEGVNLPPQDPELQQEVGEGSKG